MCIYVCYSSYMTIIKKLNNKIRREDKIYHAKIKKLTYIAFFIIFITLYYFYYFAGGFHY